MPRRNRGCPICGTTYSVTDAELRIGKRTTCSRACSYVYRTRTTKKRVAVRCPVCGIEFETKPYRIRRSGVRVCCSTQCGFENRRGFASPAMSFHGAESYASGKTFALPASEVAIAQRFRDAAIDARHQHVVTGKHRSFVVDFLLPGYGVVIELDAPDLHNRRRNLPRDAALDATLAEAEYRVVRVLDDGDTDATWRRITDALS